MRMTKEQLQEVKQKYGVDRLYSWSMIKTFLTSVYEYYLKYVLREKEDNDNCAYAPLGTICHNTLEDMYEGKISYNEMLGQFEDGWTTTIDIADLKFDRNDETKNNNISEKYKANLQHFFTHHNLMNKEHLALERFVTVNINGNILQGYIDAVYKTGDIYNIIDFKTSTEYKGKKAEDESGQLVLYAIGLNQLGVPFDKIRIGWNFLKYCTVKYQQKNGTVKYRNVERSKIGESLQTNAKMWLKAKGYEDELKNYLKDLLDMNDICVLPQDVQDMYEITDCITYIPLTDNLIKRWTETVDVTIKDILLREKDYNESKNNKVFWDTDESIKKESYYFATLCGYSANKHLPYKQYLEQLETLKDSNIFSNRTNTSNTQSRNKEKNEVDLSWLNDI